MQGQTIQLLHEIEAGVFIELEHKHLLFTRDMQPCVLTVGQQLPLSCMFEIHELLHDDQPVGYILTSAFFVRNEGGYVLTHTQRGVGNATEVEIPLKLDELVIFHYPNRGTLAVSPKVNPHITTIFEEQ